MSFLSRTHLASRRRSFSFALLIGLTTVLAVAPVAEGATAPWLSVEQYYVKLLNCTRTGGWVLVDGRCSRYGSGYYSPYVKPLPLHAGLSTYVARPYAKILAVKAACSHYLGTDPMTRYSRAGYKGTTWGENISCRSGDPYKAVLAGHRSYQLERSTNGWHWRNIKNSRFTTVGIGVWVYSGNVRLVTNFYRP